MILLLCLWGCGHRGCDVHKSTGRKLPQVDLADFLSTEDHVEDAIGIGSAQGDRLPAESLADAQGPVLEADEAVAVDLAHGVARPIGDVGQVPGKGSVTGVIARDRRFEPESLVRRSQL